MGERWQGGDACDIGCRGHEGMGGNGRVCREWGYRPYIVGVLGQWGSSRNGGQN